MRWLEELQRKMDEVPAKYLILDGTINPGERIVGKLPENLLRLWGLHLQMMDEVQDLLHQHLLCHANDRATEKVCLEFHKIFSWMVIQHEAITRIFWTEVRSEFNVLDGSVGIRAHGTVVAYDEREDQEIDDETMKAMLRQMKCGGKPN